MKIAKKRYPIVFLNIVDRRNTLSQSFITYFSLGVGYVQAFLKQRGVASLQLQEAHLLSLAQLCDRVLAYGPHIIGLACYDSNYLLVRSFAYYLKQRNPSIKVLLGGPTATASAKNILRDCTAFDACIRGEGEIALHEYFKTIISRKSPSRIPGITFREGGSIHATADQPLLGQGIYSAFDIETMPSPYLSLAGNNFSGVFPLPVITSRGCAFRCTYCNFSSQWRHTVRLYSIPRIIEELRAIRGLVDRYNYNGFISFHDDNFLVYRERAKEICRAIIRHKWHKKFHFSCQFRVDHADTELMDLLCRASFKAINFGLESANPKELRLVKKVSCQSGFKNLTKERTYIRKVKRFAELLRDRGIQVTVSIILGLPGQTIRSARRTVEFVRKLRVPRYHHNILTIFRGTELFRTHRKYGLKIVRSPIAVPLIIQYTDQFVKKVPMLKNSSRQDFLRARFNFFRQLYSGDLKEQPSGTIRGIESIYFDDVSILFKERFAAWVRSHISITACVVVVLEQQSAPRGLNAISLRKLPTHEIRLFHKSILKDSDAALSGSIDYLVQRPYTPQTESLFGHVGLMELAKLLRLNRDQRRQLRTRQISLLLYIRTRDDIDCLNTLAKSARLSQLLKKYFITQTSEVIDKCKWLQLPCPALRLRRCLCHHGGDIRPCFSAPIIGHMGEQPSILHRRLQKIYQQTMRRRKCCVCSHRHVCAKCIFPFPLSENEYCDMIRSGHVQSMFTQLKILHWFDFAADNSYLRINFMKTRCWVPK